VVQDEAVQDDVERPVGQRVQPPGRALQPLVGLALGDGEARPLRIEVGRDEPPRRLGQQVTAGVPAAADRQRIAAAEAEVAIEQLALAPLAALVLLVERRRIAEPVEQVVGRVGLAQALEATWRPAALGWRHDVALVG
jgi:hypothetical protein